MLSLKALMERRIVRMMIVMVIMLSTPVDQKNGRFLMHVGQFSFPCFYRFGYDGFILAGDVHGNTKQGLGFAVL
jgi:hypothetical protein